MAQVIVYQEAKKGIPETPRIRAEMMRRLWEYLGVPGILGKLRISKYSGISAESLLFVYILLGAVSAVSIEHLIKVTGKDSLLLKLLPTLEKLNDKALRYLMKRIEAKTYQEMHGGVIKALQDDPRMASKADGVVSGDDTIEFKDGKKMPGIQVLFKASEGRYHLGYCIVSTHYADDEKDYPLLFDIRRRSDEEEQAVTEKKEQQAMKLDLRKSVDYLRWVEHQLVILTGELDLCQLVNFYRNLQLSNL